VRRPAPSSPAKSSRPPEADFASLILLKARPARIGQSSCRQRLAERNNRSSIAGPQAGDGTAQEEFRP
jgi:hypothetical protein